MAASLRKLLSMILARIPAVLAFAVLGGVFWWGYQFDWKIPRLPVLLGQREQKNDEEEKKAEKEDTENKDNPQEITVTAVIRYEKGKEGDKPLPLMELPSEEALKRAGIRADAAVARRMVEEYVTGHGEIDFDQNHYAHLSTRASGTAWKVYKKPGDQVKKDDVLALIACPQLAQLKFDLQQTLLLVQI
ncbi:MAG TPA: hypothetical protein VH575_36035, partial [Gemmataceae bacterium]